MQFAAERQRDLRASGGGFSLTDAFGRWTKRVLPGRRSEGKIPAGATEAVAADGAGNSVPRRSQPHIHRSPAVSGRHAGRRSRARRRAERTRV
jgi:hypothetical protein